MEWTMCGKSCVLWNGKIHAYIVHRKIFRFFFCYQNNVGEHENILLHSLLHLVGFGIANFWTKSTVHSNRGECVFKWVSARECMRATVNVFEWINNTFFLWPTLFRSHNLSLLRSHQHNYRFTRTHTHTQSPFRLYLRCTRSNAGECSSERNEIKKKILTREKYFTHTYSSICVRRQTHSHRRQTETMKREDVVKRSAAEKEETKSNERDRQ